MTDKSAARRKRPPAPLLGSLSVTARSGEAHVGSSVALTRARGERHQPARTRAFSIALAAGVGLFVMASPATEALAAPPSNQAGASGGGSVDLNGAKSNKSGTSSRKKSGFKPPDFVYAGNGISVLMPMQFGFVGYQPRVRIALQYDRQLYKGHWIYFGAAALLDRGNYRTFDSEPFDPLTVDGAGDRGTVAGFDLYGGYTYKFYVKEHPWIVPVVRGGLGLGAWWYPGLGGNTPEQPRRNTFSMSARGGGGVRFFLLSDLALGVDLNLGLGFGNHGEEVADGSGDKAKRRTTFLLGMEVLPLLLEYRF